MIRTKSEGIELRYPIENGGTDIAAHAHYRVDSDENFVIEVHVRNRALLQEHTKDVKAELIGFIKESCADMIKQIGHTDTKEE